MRSFPVLLAIGSCLLVAPVGAEEPIENYAVAGDHHMHIRSAAMGSAIGQFCGVLADCEAEDLAGAVTAADALQALDAGGAKAGLVLAMGYFAGLPEFELSVEQGMAMTRSENRFVAEQVAAHSDRLVGFFGVSPLAPYAEEEIAFWLDDGRLTGLKLHLANSDADLRNPDHVARLAKVFAVMDQRGAPILIHMRTRHPEYGAADAEIFISEVLSKVKTSHVTIAHLTGWGGYDDATDAALGAFETAFADGRITTKGIAFDTAAIFLGDQDDTDRAKIAARLRRIGLDRIVLGVDWSGDGLSKSTIASTLEGLAASGLKRDEIAQIKSNKVPYLP